MCAKAHFELSKIDKKSPPHFKSIKMTTFHDILEQTHVNFE